MISKASTFPTLSTLSRRAFLAGLAAAPLLARAQAAGPRRFGDGRDWFFQKRFGLFVHWGIYSVGGWHEQHMFRRRLSRAQYAPFMRQFNPEKFDPEQWLDLALTSNRDVALTRRANTLYVHLIKEPETASVFLHPLADLPRRATLLNTGEPVAFDVADLPRLHNLTPDRCLRLKHLPVNDRSTAGWVVELDFDGLASAAEPAKKQEETK